MRAPWPKRDTGHARPSVREDWALVRGVEERGAITPDECDRLCALARDPSVMRWRLRADACLALRFACGDPALADRAARALAEVLDLGQDLNSGCALQFVQRWLTASLGFAALMVLAFGENPLDLWSVWPPVAAALFVSVGPVACASMAIEVTRLSWVRLKALEAMRDLAQPGAAPIVLKACFYSSWRSLRAARRAAEPILRAIPAEGYGLFGSAVLDMARLALDSRGSLQLACVEALERVGDGRALDPILKLAARLEQQGARADVELRDAVDRAVTVLRERRIREGDVSRLVRPAMRPDDEDRLLRPAGPGAPAETGLLLRPANDGDAPKTQDVARGPS